MPEDGGYRISMTAVWAGDAEKQAASENAIFGKYTPANVPEASQP
jgi:hypothetical protein